MSWLHSQQLWQTCELLFWLMNGLIHLLFAGAVAKDGGSLQLRGIKTILVGPATWAFTALLGGVWVAGLYWLLHHSNFTRILAQKEQRE